MKIASAQTSPVWGDSIATAQIVVDWIRQAGDQDVDLLAFGETFLSGYPYWVGRTAASEWNDQGQKEAFAHYLAAAVSVDGPEIASVVDTVVETGVFTYLGITERGVSEGTVFATFLAIDPLKGVVSAHRTPGLLYEYAEQAAGRGLQCIIAGAGGAAHLPGMAAAITTLPVLGVPVKSRTLQGVDSLLSIVQMPAGIPTATFAIGEAGATNAALFAVAMLAADDSGLRDALTEYRVARRDQAAASTLPPE